MSQLEQDLTSKAADPTAVKEFWLQTVRPAADNGRLDKIKPIPATTPRLRDVARKQNHALTQKTFGGTSEAFRRGYERIKWGSSR